MKKSATKTEKEIDDLLQEIKDRTGLTQEKIAEKIGYNRSYISQAKKKESEKLYQALYQGFRKELENLTSEDQPLKFTPDGPPDLEKAVLNLTETEKINARNIERLITLLEAKLLVKGLELPTPGTPGTETLTNKK